MSTPAPNPPEEHEKLPLEQQSVWQRLRVQSKDVATFAVLIVVGLYLLYSAAASLVSNYKSQQEIASAQNRITELKLEKERLQSLLVYYDTKSYQEIELRRRMLLKKPGETVVALRGDHPLTEMTADTESPAPATPAWRQWYDYYFSPR